VIGLLPALLHLSVFMFLFGFVTYLFTLNGSVATSVGTCVGTSSPFYLYVSPVPIYSHDSPFYTPLATIIWVAS
ncbi:hypothetical protein EI94DRAFT_1452172, partial [Lactarius quietus]